MKKDDKNKVRSPEVTPEIEESNILIEESQVTGEIEEIPLPEEETEAAPQNLSEISKIDPELLTGEEASDESAPALKDAETEQEEKFTPNEVEPIKLEMSSDKEAVFVPGGKDGKKSKGLGFLIAAVVIVLIGVGVSLFYGAGIKEKLQSPLIINGDYVDSAEFSFMYHYILIDNGVDIFASDTPDMLASESADERYATTRDYFLDMTAQEMQTIQILYDDATANGYSIESKHYELARAYIDWLQGKADELGVPLDTYIRGVFGNQVDEQCILNTLAKKYFTEDYSSGAKLVELQASEEQAEEAYQDNPNAYDTVDYKLLRIRYEQRDEAFIETANLHANEIIEAMGHDASLFESCAAEYFSGEAAERLAEEDSTLISDARYSDFTHNDFRDWLFDDARVSGDAQVFTDSDGFPIIICFVSRQRQSVPLRDVRMVHITYTPGAGEEGDVQGLTISEAQMLAQEVYDGIESESDMQETENTYTDFILQGSMEVIHSSDTYPGKYDGIVDEWIFSDDRSSGDKAFLETGDGYYIVYMVSISENPEWYDRVNSFIRMRNYQAFLSEMESEYDYSFVQAGLDAIQDVP
ncbi:MAG: hypothetical protein II718_00020 [Clostridiales bacterium]|nr:hypothetical protein [Clostridiales bacterium]